MQKILTMLFLSIFLFSFFEGKTQTSFPFPTENAVWTEVQHIFPGNTITVHYGIIGDTIIRDGSYKKIFTSKDSTFTPDNEDLSYYGAIKTQDNKTFFVPRFPIGRTEYIIYDADFQVGDTLYDGGIETATIGTIIVQSIDSIILEDDSTRKRWNFEAITSFIADGSDRTEVDRRFAFSWIEGIGNTKCPFKEPVRCAFFTSPTNRLLCFEINGQKIYGDSRYPNCYYRMTVSTNEQAFLPIVKENAEWTVLKIRTDTRIPPPPDPIDTSYVTTWIQGDTIISGIHFKKVFSREFSPGDNTPIYQGAIREENAVVTWIPTGQEIAQLDTLYNFNVQVGDTITYYTHMTSFYHYVQSIDSVELNDGTKRKRIHIYSKNVGEISPGEEINTWIEGLGEVEYGLIYPFCQQSFAPRCLDRLICYKEDDAIIYESSPLACTINETVFAPDGAEWIFNYSFAGNEGYQRISVQGDTIINGRNCRKLLWEKFFLDNLTPEQDTIHIIEGYRFTHQIGDTIFYYDDVKNEFTTLFVFNAKIGDTIFIPTSGHHSTWQLNERVEFIFVIDSISTIAIDTLEGIRVLNFKSGGCSAFDVNVETKKFIERIGTPFFLFFNEIDCVGFVPDWALRCYSDNEITYKVDDRACDFLTTSREIANYLSFKIYPNPVSETLFIETNEPIIDYILIFDAYGRLLKKSQITSSVSVSDFPKGIYWLEILDKYKNRLGISSFIIN